MPLRYAGIDPGNNGGIALMNFARGKHRIVEAFSMPIFREQLKDKCKIRTEPDFDELIALFGELKKYQPAIVSLEQLWAQLESAQTAFSLGGSYKLLRGLLHTHGFACWNTRVVGDKEPYYILIPPGQWKRSPLYRKWGLWGAGDSSKDISIDIVRGLFPEDFEATIRPLRKGSKTRRNKPHDGRSDAALIGRFGFEMMQEEVAALRAPLCMS